MNYFPKVIILSAESTIEDSISNERKTEMLKNCLEDCNIRFGIGTGFFRGEGPQTSFVVLPNSEDEIETVKSFAFKTFKQQSVLFQDNNQEAYLLNHDGTEERLGRLLEVTKEVAEKEGSYTILNGKHYTTVKRPVAR
jgi:hypothetical protein